VLAKLGVDAPLAAFELYLDAIPAAKRKSLTKPALDASDLQAVKRDFAFVVDQAVANNAIIQAASRSDNLIVDVDTFDVFTGTGVPEGMKSIAIEVVLQPRDKTLTDSEIDAVAEKVVKAVVEATGAKLRG
jgi:phenylalanyl-tRNA synthetase beta chain